MGGTSKNHIKKALKHVRNLRTWQFILILIPLLFLAATFLRLDHLKMTELKSAVLTADANENDEEIAKTLKDLQDFTFSHIVINITEENGNYNIIFGTGPFYLEHQYLRAATAAIEQAKQRGDNNPNGNIYAAASAVCQPIAIANGWAWNSEGYLTCMTTELAKYPTYEYIDDTVQIPSTELFRYNFASPLWAPTLAGFTLLLCLILIIIIIIRFFTWCILKIALLFLKNPKKSQKPLDTFHLKL